MNLIKKIIFILIFILIVFEAALLWFSNSGALCTLLKVKKQDAIKGIAVTGNVKTLEDVKVPSMVTSVVTKILVATGDYVEAGQALAELDKSVIIETVIAANAILETKQDMLKKDEVAYKDAVFDEKRYKKLFDANAISKRELEERILKRRTLEEQLKVDKKQINDASAKLEIEKVNLGLHTIKAPISGIITEKFINTGDSVAPQKTLFRLVSPKDIYLSMDVEEGELDSIQKGQNALVIFDAYPDKIFEEKVYYISKEVNPLTGTFEAKITKPKENDFKILVGMTLDATIILYEYEDVLIIPADFVDVEKNKSYVFKKSNSFAQKHEIEAEIFDNNRIIVFSGLEEGDILLKRTGTGKLKDGEKIKVK